MVILNTFGIKTERMSVNFTPASSRIEYARTLVAAHQRLTSSAFASRSGVYFHMPIASSMISAVLTVFRRTNTFVVIDNER